MAIGLSSDTNSRSKQDLIKKKLPKTVQKISAELHKIKYSRVACGRGNLGLWKDPDIKTRKTYNFHLAMAKRIYFFAYVPHLLHKKMVHQYRFFAFITKEPPTELIKNTNSELALTISLQVPKEARS
jgi:hypothetical protein